jgi:hypothetical protein
MAEQTGDRRRESNMANINAPVLRLVEQGDAAYQDKDCAKAQRLYEQALDVAKRSGAATNYVYSSLVKIYKGNSEYRKAYEMSRQALPTTAGFQDCAICLRQLAREAQNAGNASLLAGTLGELYRLAVLAYLCYGTHDCQTGAGGGLYDRAVILCQKLELRQIHATYETHGVLDGGGLLTKSDYKLFASVFDENSRTYNPHQDFAALRWEVNNEYIHWLRSVYWQQPEFGHDSYAIRVREESMASTIEWFRENAPFAINP